MDMRIEDVDDEAFWVEFRAELQKKDPIGFNLESFEHILRYTVSVTTFIFLILGTIGLLPISSEQK